VEPSVIGPPNNDNADAIDHPYSSTARVNATVDETHGFHAEEKNHEDDFDLNGPSYQPRVAVKPAYGVDDDDEQEQERVWPLGKQPFWRTHRSLTLAAAAATAAVATAAALRLMRHRRA
jgi:hypothetical protein